MGNDYSEGSVSVELAQTSKSFMERWEGGVPETRTVADPSTNSYDNDRESGTKKHEFFRRARKIRTRSGQSGGHTHTTITEGTIFWKIG